ncbi:GNAT family N-acetyltransferase [Pseudomonas sp. TTU2014-080ASC]|uniref:GNAT family N-acetyltransferase n=1 Tax=Pseudomonas sp. TTU2014-080ASC TaxID=1729724 RepID=UPI0007187512|nr:GNAT family N-acetyltransferase [Pseudomonas sp. TTU2014-080ASC]KRW59571.1 hypothetical protein AO726_12255 [Pseudomonas sp. TTU2014-080ASC]
MFLPVVANVVVEDLTLNDEEINKVVEVWYQASIRCHHFISEQYWRDNREVMAKLYIPGSHTRVAKCGGQTVGFVSLVGNTLASIFIHPDYQGMGIGKRLLQSACNERSELQLNVYCQNTNAIAFYRWHGFIDVAEGVDEYTGQPAITMKWSANK